MKGSAHADLTFQNVYKQLEVEQKKFDNSVLDAIGDGHTLYGKLSVDYKHDYKLLLNYIFGGDSDKINAKLAEVESHLKRVGFCDKSGENIGLTFQVKEGEDLFLKSFAGRASFMWPQIGLFNRLSEDFDGQQAAFPFAPPGSGKSIFMSMTTQFLESKAKNGIGTHSMFVAPDKELLQPIISDACQFFGKELATDEQVADPRFWTNKIHQRYLIAMTVDDYVKTINSFKNNKEALKNFISANIACDESHNPEYAKLAYMFSGNEAVLNALKSEFSRDDLAKVESARNLCGQHKSGCRVFATGTPSKYTAMCVGSSYVGLTVDLLENLKGHPERAAKSSKYMTIAPNEDYIAKFYADNKVNVTHIPVKYTTDASWKCNSGEGVEKDLFLSEIAQTVAQSLAGNHFKDGRPSFDDATAEEVMNHMMKPKQKSIHEAGGVSGLSQSLILASGKFAENITDKDLKIIKSTLKANIDTVCDDILKDFPRLPQKERGLFVKMIGKYIDSNLITTESALQKEFGCTQAQVAVKKAMDANFKEKSKAGLMCIASAEKCGTGMSVGSLQKVCICAPVLQVAHEVAPNNMQKLIDYASKHKQDKNAILPDDMRESVDKFWEKVYDAQALEDIIQYSLRFRSRGDGLMANYSPSLELKQMQAKASAARGGQSSDESDGSDLEGGKANPSTKLSFKTGKAIQRGLCKYGFDLADKKGKLNEVEKIDLDSFNSWYAGMLNCKSSDKSALLGDAYKLLGDVNKASSLRSARYMVLKMFKKPVRGVGSTLELSDETLVKIERNPSFVKLFFNVNDKCRAVEGFNDLLSDKEKTESILSDISKMSKSYGVGELQSKVYDLVRTNLSRYVDINQLPKAESSTHRVLSRSNSAVAKRSLSDKSSGRSASGRDAGSKMGSSSSDRDKMSSVTPRAVKAQLSSRGMLKSAGAARSAAISESDEAVKADSRWRSIAKADKSSSGRSVGNDDMFTRPRKL